VTNFTLVQVVEEHEQVVVVPEGKFDFLLF
jgi:hypothetical protein